MSARSLPDSDKRTKKVTATFTPEQYAELETAAGGVSVGAWLYGVALEAAELADEARRAAPKRDRSERSQS